MYWYMFFTWNTYMYHVHTYTYMIYKIYTDTSGYIYLQYMCVNSYVYICVYVLYIEMYFHIHSDIQLNRQH